MSTAPEAWTTPRFKTEAWASTGSAPNAAIRRRAGGKNLWKNHS
jgi:hypothetical protein